MPKTPKLSEAPIPEIGWAREAMLNRLNLIFERTTKGPWRPYQNGVHPVEVGGIGSGDDYAICTHGPRGYANADWIAAIHNDWPMIAELIEEFRVAGRAALAAMEGGDE